MMTSCWYSRIRILATTLIQSSLEQEANYEWVGQLSKESTLGSNKTSFFLRTSRITEIKMVSLFTCHPLIRSALQRSDFRLSPPTKVHCNHRNPTKHHFLTSSMTYWLSKTLLENQIPLKKTYWCHLKK